MLVIDASAWVEWLCKTPVGARIDERMAAAQLVVPDLTMLEVLSALRGLQRQLPADTLATALDVALALPAQVFPTRELGARTWALAHNLTIYDAVYVALAEGFNCPLVTCDARLARSAANVRRAQIEVFD